MYEFFVNFVLEFCDFMFVFGLFIGGVKEGS